MDAGLAADHPVTVAANGKDRTFPAILIDCEEHRSAVLVGRFAKADGIYPLTENGGPAHRPPGHHLAYRYDSVNLNVHSVSEQLRSSEPLAPT